MTGRQTMTLKAKRIESVRTELDRLVSSKSITARRRRRNIAGEKAIAAIGVERASELLASYDAGDEESGVSLAAACR
jgi:hypothetical protein